MKLCNILVDNELHLAVMTDRGVVDAHSCGLSMNDVIAGAGRGELEKIAADSSLPTVDAVELANVVEPAGKLLCVGLNYKAHADGVGMGKFDAPALFSKFGNALTYSGAEVELPEWEVSYDYEAELVIVIGKRAWNVSEEDAMDCVFGYTCGNDLSCRDPQKRTSQWLIGKTMPGFGPCGPCIVTKDSLDPFAGVSVKSYVNHELRQNGTTADMIHNCADIVSYASKYIALEPGDLIFTGTPSGVALEQRQDKRRWLEKGDRVDVEIEGIGTLTNYMV
ncbi:MAG: fumarylacetoacetate hydrolase family protein [Eubacteriales bacterium]|nr:fumarylacetoacetate hydrolase family protein [Eubacteriales bacterium]